MSLPLIAEPCHHLLEDGESYKCAKGGRCEPAYAGDLPSCDRGFVAVSKPSAPAPKGLCVNLGRLTGELAPCPPCSARAGKPVEVPVHECRVHGKCTLRRPSPGVACCNGTVVNGALRPCPDYRVNGLKELPKPKWAVGVTTVPKRLDSHLRRTLASLTAAGFGAPHLFVDGCSDAAPYRGLGGGGVTLRSPNVLVHGNWVLSLYEMYIREPSADRYAVFQDDVVAVKNLRQYLERCEYPAKGYLNLYTEPRYEAVAPPAAGWHESIQRGLGALALVFSRQAVLQLLVAPHMVLRAMPSDMTERAALAEGALYRGKHSVDGGIVTAMNQAGWREYIHRPSLVQHTGDISSFRPVKFPPSTTFPGEGFDALSLAPSTPLRT